MADETYKVPEVRTIARTNPKGENIQVVGDRLYRNECFTLHFQQGSVPMYGVRNGCFEEELLLVLIDRAKLAGDTKFQATLKSALAVIVAEDTMATTRQTTPAPATAAVPKKTDTT